MSYVLAALAALGLYYFYNRSSTGESISDQRGWIPLKNPTPLPLSSLMGYAKPGVVVRLWLTHPHPSGTAIAPLTALADATVLDVQDKDGKRFWKVRIEHVGSATVLADGTIKVGDFLPDGTPFTFPKSVALPEVGTVFALTDDNLFG